MTVQFQLHGLKRAESPWFPLLQVGPSDCPCRLPWHNQPLAGNVADYGEGGGGPRGVAEARHGFGGQPAIRRGAPRPAAGGRVPPGWGPRPAKRRDHQRRNGNRGLMQLTDHITGGGEASQGGCCKEGTCKQAKCSEAPHLRWVGWGCGGVGWGH